MNGEGCILNKKTGANPPVSCYVSGALSVVVPPAVRGGKFRTVETLQVQGLEFEEQARVIEQFTHKYNVQHIGIDVTGGNGEAVYQIVRRFLACRRAVHVHAGIQTRACAEDAADYSCGALGV